MSKVNTNLCLLGLGSLEDVWNLLPCFGVLLELGEDLLSHLLLLREVSKEGTTDELERRWTQRREDGV